MSLAYEIMLAFAQSAWVVLYAMALVAFGTGLKR